VPIKVVLAEDSYLVREGVRRLLEHEPDIELVAVCEPVTPGPALLAGVAGTVLVANLVAAWPGRVAARTRPAVALRSE
jgi:DNA-binding NarL/FixJ family response regulator